MKRRRVRFLALLLVFAPAATLLGQEKSEESEYYPLKVGTTWVYRQAETDITVRVAKQEKVGEVLCAKLETTVKGKEEASEHIAVMKDGLYRYMMMGQKAEPPVRFLLLPPKKGETWKVASKFMNKDIKATFTLGEEQVQVPAGKYQAIVVKSDGFMVGDQKLDTTMWYAKDVGMVKTTTKLDGQEVIIELKEFKAAK